MKSKWLVIVILTGFFSCEDVIEVELNKAEPRLVIEASIDWLKNTSGNEQEIKLTLSAPFFDNEVPPANGATVSITNSMNTVFNFIEDANSGIYKNAEFIPVINESYNLNIVYKDEVYTATETLKSVVPIDFIEQSNEGGFSGDQIEIKAFYTDPADEENYYLFEFLSDFTPIPSLEVYEDRFTNGNQIFGFYSDEDLEAGNIVTIRNHGASESFYAFMFLLLQQGSQDSGGPFETQPASVRGNCINETISDNFPFGYFRLSEVAEVIYTVE
jgi:hypothetical protein